MSETTKFDHLLQTLPEIAKAVNGFSSEAAQMKVLDALLGALEVPVHQRSQGGASESRSENDGTPRAARAKRATGKKDPDPKILPDLNLRPSGKVALKDFVAEKAPKSNEMLYAVIVHYLQHVLSVKSVSIDHIYTAIKHLGDRKVSTRLRTVVSNSAKEKGWLNTSNLDAIRTTVNGDNMVEHDLPAKKAK